MSDSGILQEIWRYPVKSMRGEQLDQSEIGPGGIPGDRGWAVRDEKIGEIRGAKHLRKLLLCAARYVQEPAGQGDAPDVEIRLPDGRLIRTDDEGVHAHPGDQRVIESRSKVVVTVEE